MALLGTITAYNQFGTQNHSTDLLPMSSDKSVTYVPDRTEYQKTNFAPKTS